MVTEICFPFKVHIAWLELGWDLADGHSGDRCSVPKCHGVDDQLVILSWPLTQTPCKPHAERSCGVFAWLQRSPQGLVQNGTRKTLFSIFMGNVKNAL